MKSNEALEKLIVFSRYPEPGTTKTRLARVLGDQGAAEIQKKLTEHTISQVRQFLQSGPIGAVVYFEGGSLEQMRRWLGPDFQYQHQGSGDLGKRMQRAFDFAFQQNHKRVVIIGADCPGLRASHMTQAFRSLRHKDLVLGPATDGGYYLIGLSHYEKSLFKNMGWGTDTVLAKTLTLAEQKGLSIELLEKLSDVDRPEDLKHFNHHTDPQRG
jgi:rSAM/selenodomain-associated transferase 1